MVKSADGGTGNNFWMDQDVEAVGVGRSLDTFQDVAVKGVGNRGEAYQNKGPVGLAAGGKLVRSVAKLLHDFPHFA